MSGYQLQQSIRIINCMSHEDFVTCFYEASLAEHLFNKLRDGGNDAARWICELDTNSMDMLATFIMSKIARRSRVSA